MAGLYLGNYRCHDIPARFRNRAFGPFLRAVLGGLKQMTVLLVERIVVCVGTAEGLAGSVSSEHIEVEGHDYRIPVEPEIDDLSSGRNDARLTPRHRMS